MTIWGGTRGTTPYQYQFDDLWTRGSQHAVGWSEGGREGNNRSRVDAGVFFLHSSTALGRVKRNAVKQKSE